MAGFGEQKSSKKKKNTPERKPQISGDTLQRSAINHHARGDLANAEKDYREAIKTGYSHHTIFTNLGVICKNSGRSEEAISLYKKAIDISPNHPDAYTNLGNLYEILGILDQALASTLKSLELKTDNPTAHMNLGLIYQDLGRLDQALASTLKSLELKPDNPDAQMNLGGIYKDLGNLDQALASALKSLELEPKRSDALCKLGLIKMALGQTKEARKDLFDAIACDTQECEAYRALSGMIETTEEAEELIESIKLVKTSHLTPRRRSFIEFALSNCFHKIKNYDQASKHLQLANKNKLIASASNADTLQQAIANTLSRFDPAEATTINANCGKNRIFIVGMPRSGSTLLETILSMNPDIKELGESSSLRKAITKIKQQEGCSSDRQSLDELYSQMEPINDAHIKYIVDKNLYNFIYINWITAHMPAAKIIHCRRNPMDNILSMYRSNLMAGNNYTANLEDSAKVLIVQEQAMQIHKKRHPKKIFTFDYDQFVNAPEQNLSKLLEWLGLEFNETYLHPEKSTRSVNTASVMQARKPISNKSVGGWKNYENLLKPAQYILQNSGLQRG